jgi:hypothetical protein
MKMDTTEKMNGIPSVSMTPMTILAKKIDPTSGHGRPLTRRRPARISGRCSSFMSIKGRLCKALPDPDGGLLLKNQQRFIFSIFRENPQNTQAPTEARFTIFGGKARSGLFLNGPAQTPTEVRTMTRVHVILLVVEMLLRAYLASPQPPPPETTPVFSMPGIVCRR